MVRGGSALIAHTLPFLLRDPSDLTMAEQGLKSLENSPDCCVVLYNQGYLSNSELLDFLGRFKLKFYVLGSGQNVGIPIARQECMKFIWSNLPEYQYISEIHVDMIFPPQWHQSLVQYLETQDEPMISPGIITQFGEIHPVGKNVRCLIIPDSPEEIIKLCQGLTQVRTHEGFVHPVVHKTAILKEIGGYDTRFLQGKQGYEDDSLLLGYRYYMGTRSSWKPKCYLGSFVYHATLAQRTTVCNTPQEFMINQQALFRQYGVYGLLQLAEIHGSEHFLQLAQTHLKP